MPEEKATTEETQGTTEATQETTEEQSGVFDGSELDDTGAVQIGDRKPTEGKELGEFELSEAAQKKLGINADGSPRMDDESESTETKDEKSEKEDEKKSEEGTQEEQPNKDGEGEKTETKDTEEKEEVPQIEDIEPEKLDEFMKEHDMPSKARTLAKNLFKFRASTTQKTQEVAERERVVSAIGERIGADKMVEHVEAFLKLDKKDQSEFLDYIEDYDSDSPGVKAFKLLIEKAPEAKEVLSEAKQETERELNLRVREEALDLKGLKDSPIDYSSDDELVKTGEIADEYNVNLLTAHKIRVGEQLADSVEDLKIELKTQKETYEAELAKLKDEVEKLKVKKAKPITSTTKGVTFSAKVLGGRKPKETTPGDFDATEERIRKAIVGA